MHDSRLDRRSVLAAASAGLAGAVAGCTAPRADTSIEGNSSHTIDRDDLAEGSSFTDLYRAVIDSVTQVRVFGLRDPDTGAEGRGQGSGFLYDDRHIVTNDHVIPVGGDVLLAFDGEPIPDRHALSTYLALETSPGDTLSIRLQRDGRTITTTLALDARPSVSRHD